MTNRIPVPVKLHRGAKLPTYALPGDAGADIHAHRPTTIKRGQRAVVWTGVCVELPDGWAMSVRPKSGLTKKGWGVQLGLIDSGYRGEIGVTIQNDTGADIEISPGMKVAQLVLERIPQANFTVVDALSETVRNDAGFGSTGEV